MNRIGYIKKSALIIMIIVVSILLVVIAVDKTVETYTRDRVFDSTADIPHNSVGLLPGTSRILVNGHINLYYKYRIDAAVKLYLSRKIDFILVSGDNSTKYYDEPTTIKRDLVARGVPEKRIHLDYAGFRTLDSVVRSREIFNQSSITVISQRFHNERAIFIAEMKGIRAVGFNARDVHIKYGFYTGLREKLARVKMMLDLLMGVGPKFLGEKIEIR